jgi:nitrile hydratase
MDSIHDLGGMHGFGPVVREENEPKFHTEWEKRVFAIRRLGNALHWWNRDEARNAVERMDPAWYLSTTYYEHWLASLETLLIEHDVLSREELEARIEALEADPDMPVQEHQDPALVKKFFDGQYEGMADVERDGAPGPSRFKPGDRVRTKNIHPKGHTRMPRYARGKPGVIHSVYGQSIFPDASAAGKGSPLEQLYSVRFEASDLWGDVADSKERVYVDLWDSYLEPA